MPERLIAAACAVPTARPDHRACGANGPVRAASRSPADTGSDRP